MLRLWATAKPRDRKKLLVTIDQAHRLHKQTAKPAGRVTAGAASASDKRINALLSPEQQKTYAVIESEMKAQLKARHSRTTTAN